MLTFVRWGTLTVNVRRWCGHKGAKFVEERARLISSDRPTRRTGAILLFVAGVSLFGVMDGLGKFLAADFPLPQLIWARSAFAIPIILATTAPGGWLRLLRCERPLLQAARGFLPLLASATVLMGLRFLPLADATAITFAAPLFVVALSAPILRERVGTTAWIGVGLGFLGVLIVARPGAGSIVWAALLPLATAFLFGLYQVLTRLASRSDPPGTTLAWTIITGFVLTTPLLPLGWANGSLTSWLLLILSGLLFGAGQLLLIRALAAAPAAILTPFTYTQIVAAVLFGMLVLGELPDLWALAGTALIILAGLYILRRAG
jgi:drug/metabolite transporter (DMT)-like permease